MKHEGYRIFGGMKRGEGLCIFFRLGDFDIPPRARPMCWRIHKIEDSPFFLNKKKPKVGKMAYPMKGIFDLTVS